MITIRAERDGDAAAIHAVHRAAFPTDVEARLVDRLRAGGLVQYGPDFTEWS